MLQDTSVCCNNCPLVLATRNSGQESFKNILILILLQVDQASLFWGYRDQYLVESSLVI